MFRCHSGCLLRISKSKEFPSNHCDKNNRGVVLCWLCLDTPRVYADQLFLFCKEYKKRAAKHTQNITRHCRYLRSEMFSLALELSKPCDQRVLPLISFETETWRPTFGSSSKLWSKFECTTLISIWAKSKYIATPQKKIKTKRAVNKVPILNYWNTISFKVNERIPLYLSQKQYQNDKKRKQDGQGYEILPAFICYEFTYNNNTYRQITQGCGLLIW